MSSVQYLIQINIYLVLFYGFYALLLKNETFFKLNRIYLVSSGILSFLIPLIQSDYIRSLFITRKVVQATQAISLEVFTLNPDTKQETLLNPGTILLLLYFSGAIFLLARFIWRIIKIKAAFKTADQHQAFSFFGKIKIDPSIEAHDTILDHEKVHASQWHSADIIFFEIIAIVNWFNPIVYLYKQTIKYIHEFMADEIASAQTKDKSEYALLLLSKTFGIPANQLTNNFFNHSLLKRRIMMLHKSRSARTALIKYGFSAPLFAAMLIFSSANADNSKLQNYTKALTVGSKESPLTISDNTKTAIDTNKTNENVFTSAEQMPEFPGGMKAFYEYLDKSFKYPAEARINNVNGKVILSFIVEKDGSLNDIKVLRGLGSGLDEEAKRVLKESPKWIPGKQNGKTVRVVYTLPMQLGLDQKKTEKQSSGTSNGMEQALYILDGKEVPEAMVKSFRPEKIATVNVLKGENASAAYGEKGKNGVIIITSKNADSGKTTSNSNANIKVTENANERSNISVNTNDDKTMFKNFNGLIIIDGKESDKAAAEKLDPKDIATVNVMKGGGAMNAYGEKGKNGVIVIVTKKN